MTTRTKPLGLFEAFGIEIEYMIVDRSTLAVLPVADKLLEAAAGEASCEVDMGRLAWSNELVLHVVELKTSGPVPTLLGAARAFADDTARVNALLEPLGGMLMPTGAHPLMDPARETRIWPHENNEVYRTFDRIFGCSGHGWSNLQSTHLNLPFAGDEEFGRLHAAIRLLLPIMPALSASSPLLDGRPTGLMDARLDVYRTNARRVPSVTGLVIPEAVYTEAAYRTEVLERIYADLRDLDRDGTLRHEWANARGAIARFTRGSIEVRVLDCQETPAADLAVLGAIVASLRTLAGGGPKEMAARMAFPTEALSRVLLATIRDAEAAVIDDAAYLDVLGIGGAGSTGPLRAGEVWRQLIERSPLDNAGEPEVARALRTILDEGTLARRMMAALGASPSAGRIRDVCRELAACLGEGRLFGAS